MNVADALGRTPLMAVVKRSTKDCERSLECVNILISCGADVNATSYAARSTPLSLAVREQNWGIARLLLEHGAIRGVSKRTILRFAPQGVRKLFCLNRNVAIGHGVYDDTDAARYDHRGASPLQVCTDDDDVKMECEAEEVRQQELLDDQLLGASPSGPGCSSGVTKNIMGILKIVSAPDEEDDELSLISLPTARTSYTSGVESVSSSPDTAFTSRSLPPTPPPCGALDSKFSPAGLTPEILAMAFASNPMSPLASPTTEATMRDDGFSLSPTAAASISFAPMSTGKLDDGNASDAFGAAGGITHFELPPIGGAWGPPPGLVMKAHDDASQ